MQQTTVVNINDARYDVYIGRGSMWGNPFKIGQHGSRAEVIDLYRQYLLGNKDMMAGLLALKGKVLGCHCKPAP